MRITFIGAGSFIFAKTLIIDLLSFNDLPDMEDFAGTTSIRVAATSTTDDVIAATAGSVDIWVLTSVLPV